MIWGYPHDLGNLLKWIHRDGGLIPPQNAGPRAKSIQTHPPKEPSDVGALQPEGGRSVQMNCLGESPTFVEVGNLVIYLSFLTHDLQIMVYIRDRPWPNISPWIWSGSALVVESWISPQLPLPTSQSPSPGRSEIWFCTECVSKWVKSCYIMVYQVYPKLTALWIEKMMINHCQANLVQALCWAKVSLSWHLNSTCSLWEHVRDICKFQDYPRFGVASKTP